MSTFQTTVNRIITCISIALLLTVGIFASGQPCTTTYPQCPDQNGPNGQGSYGHGGCNYPNAWDFGPITEVNFFVCNGKDSHCPNSGSNCNVMVQYSGTGRVLTCEPAGWQVSCAVTIGNPVQLNVRCDNGEKCDPDGPTHYIPPLVSPAGFSTQIALDPPAGGS